MLVSAVYNWCWRIPKVLERVARNLWGTSVELVGSQLSLAWQRLTKSEREGIVNETIAHVRDHAAAYVSPAGVGDSPPPGEARQIYRTA